MVGSNQYRSRAKLALSTPVVDVAAKVETKRVLAGDPTSPPGLLKQFASHPAVH
jgi:hypothetical protein